jgi:hypothetical protein
MAVGDHVQHIIVINHGEPLPRQVPMARGYASVQPDTFVAVTQMNAPVCCMLGIVKHESRRSSGRAVPKTALILADTYSSLSVLLSLSNDPFSKEAQHNNKFLQVQHSFLHGLQA